MKGQHYKWEIGGVADPHLSPIYNVALSSIPRRVNNSTSDNSQRSEIGGVANPHLSPIYNVALSSIPRSVFVAEIMFTF